MTNGYPVVILAAGASRRMGTPKPLLDFSGRPCLEIVLEVCRTGGCDPIVLVLGAEAERIRAGCRIGPEVVVVIHDGWERGQTGSLKAGLQALPAGAKAFFVLPADHPLVEPGDLTRLAERFRAGAGRGIVVPTHGGRRGHPVLLAAPHGDAILAMGDDVPLHDHIRGREEEIILLPSENPGVVMGMNTEEEYRSALAAFRGRGRAGSSFGL